MFICLSPLPLLPARNGGADCGQICAAQRTRAAPLRCSGADSARRASAEAASLMGKRYILELDFGREKNTWMSAVAVQVEPGGSLQVLKVASFTPFECNAAAWRVRKKDWRVPNDTMQMVISTTGFERGDLVLPRGKLFLSTALFLQGAVLGKRGNLTIKQRRFFIREEFRMVGTFKAVPVADDALLDDIRLPAMRMVQGSPRDWQ
ncbi:hypothetical protein FVE85_2245 [Porphyridium purpureum]|uniref:Uncharacterized protein n=1 Tax=Porphyridium purpureum TaxID=35688 RepID=A0A5J4YYN5_PORPP|nr:hypothetical protein FVE85_2245 [Porphyridium purpureum]|eukprot:POR6214..scf209_3